MEKQKAYFPELNWIRGICAILVMLYHFTTRYEEVLGHAVPYPIMLPWGGAAITAFFLLSGFLSTAGVAKEPSAPQYLLKRVVRLYPTYWASILITELVLLLALPQAASDWKSVLVNFTMLQSFVGFNRVDGAYWTLSYELRFYILITGMIFLFRNRENGMKLLSFLWLAASAALLAAQKAGLSNPIVSIGNILLMPEYSGTFLAGIFLYNIYAKKLRKLSCGGLLASVVLCYWVNGSNFTLFLGCTAVTVLVSMGLRVAGNTQFAAALMKLDRGPLRWLSFVAQISYPLYLTHQSIGRAIIFHMEKAGLHSELFLLIPIVVCLLLAYALHHYIEKPAAKQIQSALLLRSKKK